MVNLFIAHLHRFPADVEPEQYRPASLAHYRNLSKWPVFTRILPAGLEMTGKQQDAAKPPPAAVEPSRLPC